MRWLVENNQEKSILIVTSENDCILVTLQRINLELLRQLLQKFHLLQKLPESPFKIYLNCLKKVFETTLNDYI